MINESFFLISYSTIYKGNLGSNTIILILSWKGDNGGFLVWDLDEVAPFSRMPSPFFALEHILATCAQGTNNVLRVLKAI